MLIFSLLIILVIKVNFPYFCINGGMILINLFYFSHFESVCHVINIFYYGKI